MPRGSSSPRPARSTVRPATAPVDRGLPPSTPSRRTARARCWPRRASALLADDDFSPTYLRNATAYGSSPRLRADIVVNNLTGTAFTSGEVRLQSDGTPWRPLVHAEDISPGLPGGARGAAGGGPRPGVQRRTRRRTSSRSATSPNRCRSARAHPSPSPRAPGPTPGTTGSTSPRSTRCCPPSPHLGRRPPGSTSSRPTWPRHGSPPSDFEGPRFVRLARIRELLAAGLLDPERRLQVDGAPS